MKSLLLLTGDRLEPLRSKIDRWKARVTAQGYAVTEQIVARAETVPQVAARVKVANPYQVQLFGAIAVPSIFQGIDGHGYRPGDEDLLYSVADYTLYPPDATGAYNLPWPVPQVRSVARADFSGMAELGDEIAMMGAWLDLNEAYRAGTFAYANQSILNDELDYLDSTLGAHLIASLESVTGAGSVLDTRGKFAFDTFFATYAGKTFTAAGMYDGGHPFQVGEYNTGFEADFASGLVKMCLVLMFCSNGWRFYAWPLQRACLVGGSMAVVYGTWAPPTLATWTGSTSIGEALLAGGAVFTVIGDGTLLKMSAGDEMDPRVDDLLKRVASLETTVASLGTVQVNNGTTVATAKYFADGAPPMDVTGIVRGFIGKSFQVTNEIMGGDPLHGVQKHFSLTGTKNGAPLTINVPEGATVTL